MKKNALRVLSIAALAALFMTACGPKPAASSNGETSDTTSDIGEKTSEEASSNDVLSSNEITSSSEEAKDTVCKTIAEAIEVAKKAGTAGTEVKYTVHGTIKNVSNTTYGEMTIMDETGELYLYGLYAKDGSGYDKMEYKPVRGDEVTVEGVLKTFNDKPEMGKATLLDYVHHEQEIPDTIECKTIAEAIEVAKKAGETYTLGKYRVKAEIKEIQSVTYGQMTIKDETGELSVYGVYGPQGEFFNNLDPVPAVGDIITLEGSLLYFKEAAEMGKATMVALSHAETTFDDKDYSVKSVKDARTAEDGAKLKLTGVVAQYNVNSKKAKVGFWLVDGTESVYVYGENVAALVNVGNTITICGTKEHYVASNESSNAAKWGYKGALQITDVHLISNDKGNTAVDLSWVKSSTVKTLMDAPVTEDITTTIYKVDALIKRVDGSGFVNYYIDDIDGRTGTYAYTMANGGDLAWLDEFDGKICTVYLSILNAKSTATGCNWRVFPIKVTDDNYKFDLSKAPEYAVTYEVNDQFEDKYSSDPAMEVITNVSSELLGFKDVKISYSSSNEDVVYFANEEEKVIMHTKDVGKAVVTVTATYGDYSATTTESIEVFKAEEVSSISISQAWSSENDEIITVKGVVAGSYTNKHGFFIVDSTGIIPVLPNDGDVTSATVAVGDEVIVKGKKEIYNTKGEAILGQTQISNATVEVNNFGKHAIDDSTFIKGKTVAEIYDIANKPLEAQPFAYESEVYVTQSSGNNSTLQFKDSADASTYLQCYGSGIGQYSWITEPFMNKTVTVSFMLVNPNNKTYWRPVPFRATDGTTTVYNTLYVGAER